MLVEARTAFQTEQGQFIAGKISSAISASTRETDIAGWHEQDSVLGIIFTEISDTDTESTVKTLIDKVVTALRNELGAALFSQIRISFHVFPEDWENGVPKTQVDFKLYPELNVVYGSKRFPQALKRMLDIAGSLFTMLLLSPVLFLISAIIKLTSQGPVLFRQERVGQFGKTFEFLKFRSMYYKNDPKIHEEYVRALILGDGKLDQSNDERKKVYKLKDDPRITPFGRFLRKTSLDELPQFWNVLKGEMSLVGPRPPIPYEVGAYDIWHRSRILVAKPGITGLWQVSGRSRTTFDEMVRIDIQYAHTWSLGLDLKILMQTPRAVISGDGAY